MSDLKAPRRPHNSHIVDRMRFGDYHFCSTKPKAIKFAKAVSEQFNAKADIRFAPGKGYRVYKLPLPGWEPAPKY